MGEAQQTGGHDAGSSADEIVAAYRRVRADRDDLRRKLEFVARAATGGDHPAVTRGHPCWSEALENVRVLSDRMDGALADRDRLRALLRQDKAQGD
jgi:hypothetical protein